MWGKSTKQRKAAQRRHAKYLTAWNQKMKTLAFGWMYGMGNPGRAPPGVAEWLKWRERRSRNLRGMQTDYTAIEYRIMATHAYVQTHGAPVVVATQERTLTGRKRT